MEKYQRDGKVAVLISPGFGAGWSTWNYRYPEILFDPQVVDLVLNYKGSDLVPRIEMVCETKYPEGYFGGAEDLQVRWLDPGERFLINEYDGSESLTTEGDMKWNVA